MLGAALALAAPAYAQDYPSRPVTMIIPFAPGGGTDSVARQLGPTLSAKLGQTIVIENVSGGAGNIASARVARAAPDGYTLMMHNVAFALNASLYRRLPFDTEKDFVPIAFVNYTPLVMVGRKDLPGNTVAEVVAWMKGAPAKLAHPGVGSTGHLAAMLFVRTAGVNADLIPYRGGGPALADVIAGHVDMTAATVQAVIEPINGGIVKGIGITSEQRMQAIDKVPSLVKEMGPNLDVPFWNVLVAPKDTPQPILDKIHAALEAALADEALVAAWRKNGVELYSKEQRMPAAARSILRQQIERWGQVVRDNKIEAQQ